MPLSSVAQTAPHSAGLATTFPPEPTPHPDALLIALGADLEAGIQRQQALNSDPAVSNDQSIAHWNAVQALAEMTKSCSARTLDGLKAKFQALAFYVGYGDDPDPHFDGNFADEIIVSMMRDVLGYGPGERAAAPILLAAE